MKYQGRTNVRTTVAAIACTLVLSTTCLIGAVGPATAHASDRVSVVTVSAQPTR